MRTGRVLQSAVLIVATCVFAGAAAPAPVMAQTLKHQSNSVAILEDPATAAFRKALNSLSPALAAATRWQRSGQDSAGALTASSVTIDVPWNESRIIADRLTIGPRDVTLEGVRLDNGKGTFGAGKISGPVDAFRSLVLFAFGDTRLEPATAPKAEGPLRITDFRLSAKPQTRGDARFSSSWTGGSLVVDGLRCVASTDPSQACNFLEFTGLHAKALHARSSFAGEAEMQIGSFSFGLSGEASGDWTGVKQLASYFARPLDSAGKAIGGDLALENLQLLASRSDRNSGLAAPARVEVEHAALAFRRGSSGSLQLKGSLSSRFSPNVAKGTSVWPAIDDETRNSAQTTDGLLPLSANVEASYGDGHLSLSKLTANVAGLFDLEGSADVTGLQEIVDRKTSAQRSGGKQGLTALMGVAIRSFSLVMHDKGLSDLVETAFHASPAELLREAAGLPQSGGHDAGAGTGTSPAAGNLMSLMTGGKDMQAGLKTIIRKAAVERLSGILEKLRKDGKVELHCTSTPACISLAIASTD